MSKISKRVADIIKRKNNDIATQDQDPIVFDPNEDNKIEEEQQLKAAAKKNSVSIFKKMKNKSYGIDEIESEFKPGQISKYVDQAIIFDGCEEILVEYAKKLIEGKFKNDYFTKNDYAFYAMANKFYTLKPGTSDAERNFIDITRFFNILRRQISGIQLSDENKNAEDRKNAYLYGETTKRGEDVIKEIAWGVTHAVSTGMFLTGKNIFDIIPKNVWAVKLWNGYINCQTDISDSIKKIFILREIDDNNASCYYLDSFNNSNPPKEEPVVIDIASEEENENEKAEKINAEIDNQFITAVSNDEDKKESTPPNKEKKKKTNLLERMNNFVNSLNTAYEVIRPMLITETPKTSEEEKPKEDDTNLEQRKNFENAVNENNTAWHQNHQRLDKLTDIINESGNYVMYYDHPNFPGLIKAEIINKESLNKKEMICDPCILYGDTLRIANYEIGDIRKEIFIPISQREYIIKAINDSLTKLDKKAILDKIPSCIKNFTGKYSFLDYVDMRGLHTSERTGLPFDEWRYLVINISKILQMMTINRRFCVIQYDSPTKFILMSDPSIMSCFNSEIYNEPVPKNERMFVYCDFDNKERPYYSTVEQL